MKLFKSQSGMSLIEIMVAVSILSVIMVSVMMLGKNMDKSAKNAEKKSDIETYAREIAQVLADKDSCSATVFGANGGTGAANRTYITSLKSIDQNGKIVANPRLKVTAIDSGVKSNQVVINGMYLENKGDLGSGANYVLVVTFVKNPKAAGGDVQSQSNIMQNYVKREFPIVVDNCGRTVVKANAVGGTPSCLNAVGGVVNITSNAATNPDNRLWKLLVCRSCTATRPTAKGCI